MPIEVIYTTMRAELSFSELACILPTRTVVFPPNNHFTCFTTFVFMGLCFLQSRRARALSLTPPWSSGSDLMLSLTDFNLWQGTESLLQAGHPNQYISLKLLFVLGTLRIINLSLAF